ncbi:hypothetical protein LPJ53_002659 [Coemansia erecta]|uniref:Major facilitator superfamily (MFS) profile domain-containing protein n=1 Tax=Coemansia erecta TaxID=147472 RepID=A0A9W7Y2W4_9FUNG|nr:hypothetical protein LPJ53_002659 [Coemansia erecta]
MLAIGAGILVERFDVRLVVAFGCMLSGVSLLVASACKSPIALLFTQGILLGAGGSCIQVPAVSLPGQWMKRYRAIATGIAIAGGPIGGVWMSFATRAMSLRVSGLLVIGVGLAVCPLLRNRITIPRRDKIIDTDALKNAQFPILFFAMLFVSGGYFMPYYFMSSYTVVQLGRPAAWGANISSIMNASSIVGRLATGVMADYLGALNSLILTSVISTAMILGLWLPFRHLGTLIATAAVYGFTSGSAISLVPVITANIFGVKRLPSIIGMVLFSYAIGTFLCSPIGGVLLDKYGHGTDYSSLIIYGGVFFGVGTLLLIVLRSTLTRAFTTVI